MDDQEEFDRPKLKLGKRTFEKVNQPTPQPDPNAAGQILDENKQRDPTFSLEGIDVALAQQFRARRLRDLKVIVFLGVFDAGCLAIAAAARWSPYLTVPLISAAAIVTVSTLWIVYVVGR